MRVLLPACLAVATAVAACAPVTPSAPGAPGAATQAEAASARPCFYSSQIRNFRADRNQRIYVRTGRDEVFELVTTGACLDIDSAIGIALVQRFGAGSDRLCPSDQVNVVISHPSPIHAGPCLARVERRLTAEQVAALPDRARP